ncbi:syntaxin-10 isoform X2 [Hemicordylus capensis]|uniref:syntaxin-10 isoform X2 n=1 Tax=Hemicordylus capensis TaxID=884348 RepID=UPI002302C538|nr:syntaxin-10 isoform X2 [Hemicordylus capensis]
MSLEDPFFVVKGEVQKAMTTACGLYQRWCQLLQETQVVTKEELDWTTNELRNNLRSIEWDLEDLEETICIVESNPRKFKIEPCEVAARRSFVTEMQKSIKEMQDHISSPQAQAVVESKNKEMLVGSREHYGLLDAEDLSTANSRTLEEQQLHQKLIIDKQDEQLELVSGTIRVLKHMSGRVGEELDEQTMMLEDFAYEMDSTHSRMDGVLKKIARVSHMASDRRQWCGICLLLFVLVLVVVLLFTL